MSVRTWVFARLRAAASITVPDARIIGSAGIVEGVAPPARPFIVIDLGINDPYEGTAERTVAEGGPRQASAQRLTIWVHNEPGDLETVDTLLAAVRSVMLGAPPDPANNIIEARFVSESEDLPDDGLGTVTRYSRWQIVLSK